MNHLTRMFALVTGLVLLGSGTLQAAQQFQGLCSYVKIEILQELALERIGFLATLEITNNEGDASITDFSAALTFQKRRLSLSDPAEDASDLFFVQQQTPWTDRIVVEAVGLLVGRDMGIPQPGFFAVGLYEGF